MKKRNKPEIETKDQVVSEICIETENKGNIFSTANNIPKFHKKEKIFLTKKRKDINLLQKNIIFLIMKTIKYF